MNTAAATADTKLAIPCMDWSCQRAHEIRRSGPTLAAYHVLPCRVSATGSQGSCGFSGTAAEVVEHSAAVHHWHTDIATIVRTDQRYAAVQA